MIGKKVKVIIDRPIGTVHPIYKNIQYSLNYGYVPGIFALDGEEQDAYVLGISYPIDEFVGIVIAIIHRRNDIENKWVVAQEGTKYNVEDIEKAVSFQEKYFDYYIEIQ